MSVKQLGHENHTRFMNESPQINEAAFALVRHSPRLSGGNNRTKRRPSQDCASFTAAVTVHDDTLPSLQVSGASDDNASPCTVTRI